MTAEFIFEPQSDPKRVLTLTRIARDFVMHDQ